MNVVANGSGATMAEARFVWMPASKAAAVAKSPEPPAFVMVDQSPASGWTSNRIVPLPFGPTEMAARKEGAAEVRMMDKRMTTFFITTRNALSSSSGLDLFHIG